MSENDKDYRKSRLTNWLIPICLALITAATSITGTLITVNHQKKTEIDSIQANAEVKAGEEYEKGYAQGKKDAESGIDHKLSDEYSRGYEDGKKLSSPVNNELSTNGLSEPSKAVSLSKLDYFNYQSDYTNIIDFSVEYANDNTQQDHSNGIIYELLSFTNNKGNDWLYTEYLIHNKYSKLTGTFALSYVSRTSIATATLYIYGAYDLNDEYEILFTSKTQTNGIIPEPIDIDISNLKKLKIEIKGYNRAGTGYWAFYDAQLLS